MIVSSEKDSAPRRPFWSQVGPTGAAAKLNGVVEIEGRELVFLHAVAPEEADRRYGVAVAKLAGMPRQWWRGSRRCWPGWRSRSAAR